VSIKRWKIYRGIIRHEKKNKDLARVVITSKCRRSFFFPKKKQFSFRQLSYQLWGGQGGQIFFYKSCPKCSLIIYILFQKIMYITCICFHEKCIKHFWNTCVITKNIAESKPSPPSRRFAQIWSPCLLPKYESMMYIQN
jgi:hypothetical protein